MLEVEGRDGQQLTARSTLSEKSHASNVAERNKEQSPLCSKPVEARQETIVVAGKEWHKECHDR